MSDSTNDPLVLVDYVHLPPSDTAFDGDVDLEPYLHLLKARERIDDAMKQLGEAFNEVTSALLVALGNAATGHVDGMTVVRRHMMTRTSIDTKQLKARYPDVAVEVTRTATYPRITWGSAPTDVHDISATDEDRP